METKILWFPLLILQAVHYRGAGTQQRILQQPKPSAETAVRPLQTAGSQFGASLLFYHHFKQRGQCLCYITGPACDGVPVGYVGCPKTNQKVLDDCYRLHRGMNTHRYTL